jgi:WD40 repeat protein
MSNFQHSYALVIGINNYNNGISSLKTAVSDATEIAHILESKQGYTVTLLVDNGATLGQIRQVLETELPNQIQKGDRFLFYFAGHGIAMNGEDGPEGYLVPQDAKSGSISTYLRMSEVNKALLQLPCRHFLGILDCCFAGAFRWSSTRQAIPLELLTLHKERYDRFIQDPAWQVITSAAYDQTAMDAFDLKDDRGQTGVHSPFANALIAALEGKADAFPPAEANKPAGDGVITASELYLYVREQVEIATEVRAIRQTPGIYPMNKHDKGEYIFLTPGHALNLPPAPPLDVSKNPYRGLLSFGEEHSDLFFGKSALTQKLYEFVTSSKLTVVLGASGSGKSSLVQAGLIPKLRKVKDSNTWFILPPFRPGESPFKALNNALASVNQPAIAPPHEASSLGLLTPGEGLGHWFTEHPQGKLLLVVDQFEELITLCQNDSERQQFLAALAGAIATYPNQLHLVLTLRSDFEPQFRNTVLEKDWQTARFIVPAMKREELREAIEAPASARVMYFDPHELVDQLIDEVANMPGALPLLSFALSELYLKYLKRQEDAKNRGETIDRAITQADYQELGGVTRSLTQRADQEYEELVKQDPAYAQTIRNVMLRMVAVGGELARRRVPMSELEYPEPENTRVKTVIQHFSAARLLTHGIDSEAQPYVEPAHDALVRGWQKLLEWNKEELILQRRVTPSAEEWGEIAQEETSSFFQKFNPFFDWLDEKLNSADRLFEKIRIRLIKLRKQALIKQQKSIKSSQFLWHTDPRLDLLKQVLESKDNWLNQEEQEFIKKSLRKRRDNRRQNAAIITGVILGLSGLTGYALVQQSLAIKNAREIEQKKIGIQLDLLGVKALQQFENTQKNESLEIDALISALTTGRNLQNYIHQHQILELQKYPAVSPLLALQTILDNIRERNRIDDNSIQLLSNQSHPCVTNTQLPKPQESWNIEQNIFSSDCKQVIFVGSDDNYGDGRFKTILELWQNRNKDWRKDCNFNSPSCWFIGKLNLPWIGEEKNIEFVNPKTAQFQKFISDEQDNQYFVTQIDRSNRLIQFWRFSSNLNLQRTEELAHEWNQPLFLKEGSFSAELETEHGEIQITITPEWDWDELRPATLSPDGKYIIASDNISHRIGLFDSKSGKQLQQWDQQNKVNSVFFTSDSQHLVIVDEQEMRILKNFSDLPLNIIKISGNPNWFRSASLSPDGQRIATGGNDYTVRLWDIIGRQLAKLELLESQTYDNIYWITNARQIYFPEVSFSSDGQNVLIDNSGLPGQIPLIKWKVEGLDDLLTRGCSWLRDYLRTYPEVSQQNSNLCPAQK